VSLLELVVEIVEPHAHAKRRAEGPRGVVLVGDGSAERCHHSVSDELLDRSALSLDLCAHRVGVRSEHVLEVLGVEGFAERRGVGDVGEEDRDEPALGRPRWLV
jgi:hypothetical protein